MRRPRDEFARAPRERDAGGGTATAQAARRGLTVKRAQEVVTLIVRQCEAPRQTSKAWWALETEVGKTKAYLQGHRTRPAFFEAGYAFMTADNLVRAAAHCCYFIEHTALGAPAAAGLDGGSGDGAQLELATRRALVNVRDALRMFALGQLATLVAAADPDGELVAAWGRAEAAARAAGEATE